MARIGFLPHKSKVEVREPDGDTGEIPGATATAAGVMTARHVEMLESLVARGADPVPSTTAPMTVMPSVPHIETMARLAELEQHVGQVRRDVEAVAASLPQISEPLPDTSEAVASLDRRLAELAERIEVVAAQPIEAGRLDDLPAFLGGGRPHPDHIPITSNDGLRIYALERAVGELQFRQPVAPVAPDLAGRLAAVERTLQEMRAASPARAPVDPLDRLADHVYNFVAARSPSLRLVEVAHHARNGQPYPLDLMELLGREIGMSATEAADDLIRRHDAAAALAVRCHAIELAARRRIVAGEDVSAIVAEAVAAIDSLGAPA